MLLLLIKAVWGTVTGGRFPLGRLAGIGAIHGQTVRTKETRDWKDERAEALILLGIEIIFLYSSYVFFCICPKFFFIFVWGSGWWAGQLGQRLIVASLQMSWLGGSKTERKSKQNFPAGNRSQSETTKTAIQLSPNIKAAQSERQIN